MMLILSDGDFVALVSLLQLISQWTLYSSDVILPLSSLISKLDVIRQKFQDYIRVRQKRFAEDERMLTT